MSTTAKNKNSGVAGFLDDLRPEGRCLAITSIPPDGGATTTRTFSNAAAAREFIVEQNSQGSNAYYTLNITGPISRKPKKGDIVAVAYLHVDADPAANETSEAFKKRMLKRLQTFEPRPTFTIDSGNGLQLLWELKEPVPIQSDDDIAAIESRNFALALKLGASPSTRNIDRLLRVPGTINYPNATKRKAGRVECRARYLHVDSDAIYTLNDFPEHVDTQAEPAQNDGNELPAKLRTLLMAKGEGGYPSRSELLLAYLTGAIRAGIDNDVIVDACLDPTYAGCGIYQHIKSNGGRNGAKRQLAHARDMVKTNQTSHSWDDPDRSLLDDRRGKLPSFPIDTIKSDKLRDWLERAAHGTGTTVDHVALPLFVIASSLIGASRRVEASRSFVQPFTLWGMLVAPSGAGKTPGIDASRNALAQIEWNRESDIAEAKRRHDEQVQRADAAHELWKKQTREAVKLGRPTPIKPDDAQRPCDFVEPRLFVTDATIEKLALLLQARSQGMLLVTDELAGWFANMSRYSGGSDNQFWLTAWDGRPHTVERMGRPSVKLPRLLIGICGGIQPDLLGKVFDGPADGMSSRFLYVWPGDVAYRPLSDALHHVDQEIVNILDRLSNLPKRENSALRLTDRARAEFEDVRKRVFKRIPLLDGRVREWWAKIPIQVLRLAGTLSYLRWAADGGPEPKQIRVQYIRSASDLVFRYFSPHANVALRQIGLNQRHSDSRRVLRWLAVKGCREVTREQIRTRALGQIRDAEQTTGIIAHLSKAGWLRQIAQSSSPKGGRPKLIFEVNPVLHDEV